jgi:DNA-binding MarR family transcriptional regulator
MNAIQIPRDHPAAIQREDASIQPSARLRTGTMARRLDLRSASVSVVLHRLEATGLIEHIRDDHDRRRVTVRALPHAVEMLFDTWAPIVGMMDDVGHDLTQLQQQAVCTFFDQVTAVIERNTDEPAAADDSHG